MLTRAAHPLARSNEAPPEDQEPPLRPPGRERPAKVLPVQPALWRRWPMVRFSERGRGVRPHATLLDALDPADLAEVQTAAALVTVPAHSRVFQAGDPADHIFVINHGMVKLSRVVGPQRLQVLGFPVAGDVLGLSMDRHYTATAEALTATHLWRLPRARAEALALRHPQIAAGLLRKAEEELIQAHRQLTLIGRAGGEARVLAFLGLMAESARRMGLDDARVALPMTRRDMADFLGLTESFVSRTLRTLHRQKLIQLEGRTVRILDRAGVEGALGAAS